MEAINIMMRYVLLLFIIILFIISSLVVEVYSFSLQSKRVRYIRFPSTINVFPYLVRTDDASTGSIKGAIENQIDEVLKERRQELLSDTSSLLEQQQPQSTI